MFKTRFPDWLISLIAVLIAFALALYIRIALPWDAVFSSVGVRLPGVDDYFYMRIVDNLVHNFPLLINFDPYMIYPGGDYISRTPAFFAYILAGSVRLFGGAAPDQQTIDSIAAFVPPVLGTLTVIPAFFIGQEIGGRWSGLVAALLVAVLPGEMLSRTLLGDTDHHVAELLMTAFFSMFFIFAIKHGRRFTYAALLKGNFPSAGDRIPYAILAGIFFGLYLITWQGAPMFVFIILVYLVLQFISDHLRGITTDYLSKTAVACFLIALLIMLPFYRERFTLLGLAAVMLVPVALNILSWAMSFLNLRRIYFPAVVASLGILAGLTAWLAMPNMLNQAVNYLVMIFSWHLEQNVVGEMKPLLFPGGHFTLDMVWLEYGLALYSGLAALILLAYRAVRRGQPDQVYFIVMALVLLLASLAKIRFVAYFGFMLTVLNGCLIGWTVAAIVPTATKQQKNHPTGKAKRSIAPPRRIRGSKIAALALVIAALAAVLVTSAVSAAGIASNPAHMPTPAWIGALEWLRKNTPEPFGEADYYYRLYETPAPGAGFNYPSSMYSVAGWIDYGYWILRIGHRVPVNNPAQWLTPICSYYTAQDQSTADALLQRLKSHYVIIDNRVASSNDKFYAVVSLINRPESDFYELCWQKQGGKYAPLLVFYPEYYRSMLIRLYGFDGKQVIPQITLVMAYAQQQLPDGQKFREILGLKSFRSYAEAQAYINTQKQDNYSIIGTDPLTSPVPLESLNGYKLVYQSPQQASIGGSVSLPEVKIFEYRAEGNE